MNYKKKYDELSKEYSALQRQIDLVKESVSQRTYDLGDKFFETTVQHLNKALKADFTFIGKVSGDKESIETICLASDNSILNNFSYNLKDTPCANVVNKTVCCYPKQVTKLFPKDFLLQEMGIEGYVGVPLFDTKHKANGILVSMYRNPIADATLTKAILMIFSGQAGAELEHQRIYKELGRAKKQLQEQNITLLQQNKKINIEKNRFKILTENLPDVVMTIDRDYKVVYINRTLIGLKPEEVIGKNLLDLDTDANRHQEIIERIDKVFRTGEKMEFERELNSTQGIFYLKVKIYPQYHGENINNLIYIISDITHEKNLEKEKTFSEERYTNLLKLSNEGIFRWDFKKNLPVALPFDEQVSWVKANLYLAECNPAFAKIYGYSKPAEVIGFKLLELLSDDEESEKLIENYIRSNYNWTNFETKEITKTGTTKYLLNNLVSLFEGEYISHLWGTQIDITERKLAEEKLQKSEERYKRLSEASFEGIAISKDGKIVDLNEQLARMHGYTIDEFKALGLKKIVHPEDLDKVMQHNIENSTDAYEHRSIAKDGSLLFLEVRAGEILDKNTSYRLTIIRDVTEHRNKELRQKEADERMELSIRGAGLGLWNWNVQTGETIFNERWAEIVGFKLSEFEPVDINTWADLCHPEDLRRSNDLLNQHFEGKTEYYECEARMKHKNGNWVWVLDRGKVFEWTKDGKPLRMSGTHLDITHRKNTELALRESEERFAAFMSNTPVHAYIKDKDLRHIYGNRFLYDLFKFDPAQTTSATTLFNKDISELLEQADKEILNNESSYKELEYKTRINNREVWLRDIKFPITMPDKSILLGGVAFDITEQKKNEEALKESHTKYKTLADYNYDWEYWREGGSRKFIYVSPSCKRITGYSDHEFMKNPNLFSSIIQKEDLELWVKHEEEANKHLPCKVPIEFRIQTKSGKLKWINHICQPVYDNQKKFIGNRGTNRDVTEQKLSQLALIESETRFKQLADMTFEGILIHKKGIIENVNPAFLNMTGYNQEELIGEDVNTVLVPEKYHDLVLEKRKLKSINLVELEITNKDGKPIAIEAISKEISGDGLRVVSVRDISERKEMQRAVLNAIIQTEEEERKRIAQELHDGLGPVLSTVKLYTQTYLNSKNPAFKEKVKEQLLAGIDDALDQVSAISNNLSPHVLNDFGLKAAIRKFIDKIKKLSNTQYQLELNLQTLSNKEIEITLYRIVIELINNSLKHAKASLVRIELTKKNRKLHLIYSDNGKGFDFYKVKKQKKGMGLFNIVNRIHSLGGEVLFTNLKKEGIIYDIWIPEKEDESLKN